MVSFTPPGLAVAFCQASPSPVFTVPPLAHMSSLHPHQPAGQTSRSASTRSSEASLPTTPPTGITLSLSIQPSLPLYCSHMLDSPTGILPRRGLLGRRVVAAAAAAAAAVAGSPARLVDVLAAVGTAGILHLDAGPDLAVAARPLHQRPAPAQRRQHRLGVHAPVTVRVVFAHVWPCLREFSRGLPRLDVGASICVQYTDRGFCRKPLYAEPEWGMHDRRASCQLAFHTVL